MYVTPRLVLAYAILLAVASAAAVVLCLHEPAIESPAPLWVFSVFGFGTVLVPRQAFPVHDAEARKAIWAGAAAVLGWFVSLAVVYLFSDQQHSLGAAIMLFSIGLVLGCIRVLDLLGCGVSLHSQTQRKTPTDAPGQP